MTGPSMGDATVADLSNGTRLLDPNGQPGLDQHVERCGPRQRGSRSLIDEVERSGLRGRGGAAFPTAIKLSAVLGRRSPVIVANATEGEPLSSKDKALVTSAPHLVLDGAAGAAEAVGAGSIIICVERNATAAWAAIQRCLSERTAAGVDDIAIRLELTPDRYIVGEETALIHWLNGGDAKPTMVPPRPFERGVGGRPTVVQNVETLAHLALIARFGAAWFRQMGTTNDPGTRLLTVSGGVARPGVYEVPCGFELAHALEAAGVSGAPPAVLAGGYFGTWLTPDQVQRARLDIDSMRALGAAPGCGVLWALPAGACGLAESARVSRWYANQSAGQCGPCVNGLPAIADAFDALVTGKRAGLAADAIRRWTVMVTGRGACRHPDGAARFVTSALNAFAPEIDRHARIGPCSACRQAPLLPTPAPGGWR